MGVPVHASAVVLFKAASRGKCYSGSYRQAGRTTIARSFSPEEDAYLRESKAAGIPANQQVLPGRSPQQIARRRTALGLTNLHPGHPDAEGLQHSVSPPPTPVSTLPDDVAAVLKGGSKQSLFEMADRFAVPPKAVREAVANLKEGRMLAIAQDGEFVWIGEPISGGSSNVANDQILMKPYLDGLNFRFGVVSDNHMGSRYARDEITEALYDVYAAEGISLVLNCGNWIDGEARFNKNDLRVHGMGNQFRHFAERYPRREGISTEFIGGDDHEGWYTQREGVDLGAMFDAYCHPSDPAKPRRDDLVYRGYMEHDKIIQADKGICKVRMLHAGGGSSYAISYTTQKLIESLTGGEKPQVLLIGHYHKAEYIFYRNIHAIQAGCTQDQTPFMRKKRLSAHLGGWIVDLTIAPDGSVRRCKQEFINFYDKQYHAKEWRYQQEAA
jgi:predicted phosphodiesterase